MKKPVASRMVTYVLASSRTTNPTEPVSKETFMTMASPQRLVAGPVNVPLPTVDTTAITIRIVPTR